MFYLSCSAACLVYLYVSGVCVCVFSVFWCARILSFRRGMWTTRAENDSKCIYTSWRCSFCLTLTTRHQLIVLFFSFCFLFFLCCSQFFSVPCYIFVHVSFDLSLFISLSLFCYIRTEQTIIRREKKKCMLMACFWGLFSGIRQRIASCIMSALTADRRDPSPRGTRMLSCCRITLDLRCHSHPLWCGLSIK